MIVAYYDVNVRKRARQAVWSVNTAFNVINYYTASILVS